MAENKKYYWLKLKEGFFEEKQIRYLRSLPDGDKIVIAYLKMQLKSLKTEGFIKYDSILPSNVEELAMILDEDTKIVTLMINALQQAKAIEILDDGSFYMIAMQELIGNESESAERVRKFRAKKQKMLQCNDNVTKCNIEIEIDKEKRENIYNNSIYDFVEQNFGRTLNGIEIETIREWEDNELTRYAIKQAVLNGKYNIKYINTILVSYKNNSITTVQQAQEEEERFKNRNKKIPNWFDKEVEKEQVTEEDKNMIEDLLKEYK